MASSCARLHSVAAPHEVSRHPWPFCSSFFLSSLCCPHFHPTLLAFPSSHCASCSSSPPPYPSFPFACFSFSASLIALFDGHCGSACSHFCSVSLPSRVASFLVKPLPRSKSSQFSLKEESHGLPSSPTTDSSHDTKTPPSDSSSSSLSKDLQATEASPNGSINVEETGRKQASSSSSSPPPTHPQHQERAAASPHSSPSPSPSCSPLPSVPLAAEAARESILFKMTHRCPSPLPPFPLANPKLRDLFPSLAARLVSAFKHTDREFLTKHRTLKVGGCTAIVLLVLDDVALVASVGDSRAVAGLYRGSKRKKRKTYARRSSTGRARMRGVASGQLVGVEKVEVILTCTS